MSNRIYALVCNKKPDVIKANFEKLRTYDDGSNVLVFAKSGVVDDIVTTKIPDDMVEIGSKIHNLICRNILETEPDFKGFVHVIQESISICDGHKTYVDELENLMNILDYDVHFSTTSDPCNYVFTKFNPRVILKFDNDTFKALNPPSAINMVSHSNSEYITMNFAKYDESKFLFDDRFTIPMFYIIEFLLRRKNTKIGNQPYFMNQYIGVSSEKTAYTCDKDPDNISQDKMAEEDKLFRSLNLDIEPDNNIDKVLETIYEKLLEKLNR